MSATFSGDSTSVVQPYLAINLYYKNIGENMATNATWTVVFEDKMIIKQKGDAAGICICNRR